MDGTVVGVDGSDGSDAALDWALREAASRGGPLTAALAWDPGRHAGHDDTGDDDARAARRVAAVAGWVEAARGRTGLGPDAVAVDPVELRGTAAPALLALAEDAGDELVVGRCGRGRVSRMVVGSVTTAVAQHATVPVTVVRGPDPARDGPVVVGVDGSATSVLALRHGAEVARRTGATLEALFCWQIVTLAPLPDSWGWAPPVDDYEAFAAKALDGALARAGVDLPAEQVQRTVRHVNAAKGVIEASSHAGRLVLGSRGVGGFDRLLLGSVTRHAVEYAHCPVTVVRPPRPAPPVDAPPTAAPPTAEPPADGAATA
ncbi:universal stress protein [Cellulosimicrobium marinum]|uniref:universal stress protein n=1 Tax=Cellulosimicrobium marinum TaxID=1638992 RepID=UPI001E5F52B1|nr:universal stress protein [Cellulosimicrobium marinum]MCB7135295.1 universal stress protein [Cellulosimicrobium marinum]